MKHDIKIEGLSFRLRPIELRDASLIVELRSDPDVTRFLHPIVLTVEVQEQYLQTYFEREHDYYFAVERISNSFPEGLISLYNIDPLKGIGEFGRWITRKGSLAALESAYLLYSVGFERLHLNTICCHTIRNNEKVVSFHQSCGAYVHQELKDFFCLNQVTYDVIEQRVTKEMWETIKPSLYSKLVMLRRILNK